MKFALADTHYLATTGSDAGDCTGSPCLTTSYAFSQMTSGDTLVIAAGTYTGANNLIDVHHTPPPGISASQPTIIKAADGPGSVQFDGQNTRVMFSYLGPSGGAKDLQYTKWVSLEFVRSGSDYLGYGLQIVNGDAADFTTGTIATPSLKIYFKQCGFHGEGNSVQLMYIVDALFEDCYTWGNGRYGYDIARSENIIVRRNVDRRDNLNAGGSDPSAGYINYASHNLELQNCISIDTDNALWDEGTAGVSFHDPYGGFYVRNSYGARISDNTHFRGCMVVNYNAAKNSTNNTRLAGWYIQADPTNTSLTNCIVVGSSKGILVSSLSSDVTVDHASVLSSANQTGGTHHYAFGDSSGAGTNHLIVTNSSAVSNAFLNAFYYVANTSDYNAAYGNADNTMSVGTHNVTSDAGILYPVRIESGSTYDGAASDGGDIGATILKKYGTDGAFYGDSGYAALSNADLWPWPDEAVIGAAFRRDYGTTDEMRGFCAKGQTLTRYIWEYLGHTMPSDIYDSPKISSATISADGTTLTLTASEALTQGTGYDDTDFDIDCSAAGNDLAITYLNGNGTGALVYEIGSTIRVDETCNLDFNGDADSLEDFDGYDLAAIVNQAVVNHSSQEISGGEGSGANNGSSSGGCFIGTFF